MSKLERYSPCEHLQKLHDHIIVYIYDRDIIKYDTFNKLDEFIKNGGNQPFFILNQNKQNNLSITLPYIDLWLLILPIAKKPFNIELNHKLFYTSVAENESYITLVQTNGLIMTTLETSEQDKFDKIVYILKKYEFKFMTDFVNDNKNKRNGILLYNLTKLEYRALNMLIKYLPSLDFSISDKDFLSSSEINELIIKYPKLAIDHIYTIFTDINYYQSILDIYMNYPEVYHEIYNVGNNSLSELELDIPEMNLINYYLAMILLSYPKNEENNKQLLKHLINAGEVRDAKRLWNNLMLEQIGIKFGDNLGFDLDLNADTLINLFSTIKSDRAKINYLENELKILKK